MENSAESDDRGREEARTLCYPVSARPTRAASSLTWLPRHWHDLEESWKRYWLGPRRIGISDYAASLPDDCWQRCSAMLRRSAKQHGYTPTEAEDLAQAFFLDLFQHRHLDSYDADRGSFRGFLLLLFKRFASKYARRNLALKRGGRALLPRASDDHASGGDCDHVPDWRTPDRLYQRKCLAALVQKADRRVRIRLLVTRDGALLPRLAPLLEENGRRSEPPAQQPQVLPGALKMRLCRLRQRYLSLLRQELKAKGVLIEEFRD